MVQTYPVEALLCDLGAFSSVAYTFHQRTQSHSTAQKDFHTSSGAAAY
jgi:hypothetical protein